MVPWYFLAIPSPWRERVRVRGASVPTTFAAEVLSDAETPR